MRPLALFALLALAACGGDPPPPPGASGGADGPLVLTDDAGREVRLEAPARRVAPLAPNLTELVAAAAGVGALAGVSPFDDFPAEVSGLPQFGTLPPDREALVALGPDLVLGTEGVNAPADLDALAALGLPAYAFRFGSLADVPRALRRLDTLLGASGGTPAAEDFEARVAEVEARTAGVAPRRVLLLVGAEGGTLYAFGRGSYASELVRAAGGENLTDAFPGDAAQPSVEWVLEQAPDVIAVAGRGDVRQRLVEAAPALASLPAVQDGRVVAVDPDHLLRPGPRTVLALEALARRLHPEAFAAGAA